MATVQKTTIVFFIFIILIVLYHTKIESLSTYKTNCKAISIDVTQQASNQLGFSENNYAIKLFNFESDYHSNFIILAEIIVIYP